MQFDQTATFTDVLVREEDDQVLVSYRSGLTTYTETFRAGGLLSLGWEGAGFVSPSHMYPDISARTGTESFQLTVNGQSLISDWTFGGVTVSEHGEGKRAELLLEHADQQVSVRVITLLDGTAILHRWLEITNAGEGASPVGAVAPWSGLLWSQSKGLNGTPPTDVPEVRVGYMQDSRWGQEGDFGWQELPESALQIKGRTARGPFRHPMFVLDAGNSGEHYIGQLAWSGGYKFTFDYERYAAGALEREPAVVFEVAMDAQAPQIVLDAGETVTTAEVHLGMVIDDLDAAVAQMHRHLRRGVLQRPTERLGIIEGGVGPEQDFNEESLMFSLDVAKEVGSELLIIDAGWYADTGDPNWGVGVGDWEIGSRFPNGFAPIRERAHELGIKFGLWMEPERIGRLSRAATEHADFYATDYRDKTHRELIDLGRPEVLEWVENHIVRLVEEFEVDLFRLDFNTGHLQDGYRNTKHGFNENFYWRYYKATYEMFARLRERFPDVLWENCSSGGGRTDLGMVQQFDTTWVTDWQHAPRSFDITNGMTIALPPEFVDRHVGMGMKDHRFASLAFQARVALFGHPTMSWTTLFGAANNPEHIAVIREHNEIYRDHVRPTQITSTIYHHTPVRREVAATGWGVLERAADDRSTSVIGVFRTNDRGADTIRVRPRGIDPGATYDVYYGNERSSCTVSGRELVEDGFRVSRRAALTSQLFVLTRTDGGGTDGR